MISNTPLDNLANSNLAESTSTPVKITSGEAINDAASEYKKPVNINPEKKIISNPTPAGKQV